MNSLMNYDSGSDGEDSNNSDKCKAPYLVTKSSITVRRESDAIYDSVPMDMSEESNHNGSGESNGERSPNQTRVTGSHRTDSRITLLSDQRRPDREEHSKSHDVHKHCNRSDDKDKNERIRHDSKKIDDKKRFIENKDSKDFKKHRDDDRKSRDDDKKSRDTERKSRENDRRKEKSNKDDKSNDRSEKDHRDERKDKERRDDKDKRRERDKDKDKDKDKDRDRDKDREKDRDRDRERDRDRIRDRDRDRDRERDRDRDRRHSKDEKFRDRYRDDRHSRDKDRGRSRSRSRSRDRLHRPFSYREERNKNKLAQLEKLGIEIKTEESTINQEQQSFYNPLTTATQGKYAEQIQKRKLLWANKKAEENKSTPTATTNTWVGTTFTHDQDGKVTAKFKRLMGIKGDVPTTPTTGAKPDILKKQEEMFNNMEQQYEVARATTHTQRGVGLGYASGSYPFPR